VRNPDESDMVTSDGRFTCELVNGVPVVAAPEEIDITNAPELRSALLAAAAHGRGTLVVDLTRTRFCDSATLHTLVAAHKRAQAEAGELRLAVPAVGVLRVFEISGLYRMIPSFPSLEQALADRSATGPDGYQRPGGPVEGSELAAQAGTGGLTEKPADHVACASPRGARPGHLRGKAVTVSSGPGPRRQARRVGIPTW
jgi:anti-sigma B factor antagonist